MKELRKIEFLNNFENMKKLITIIYGIDISMKIKCDFCKTEYHIDNIPNTPVQCALCGHTWTVVVGQKRNALLMFFASLCALLSAIVFYFLIHEGAHLIYALLTGTFKNINFIGLGIQIDIFREKSFAFSENWFKIVTEIN